jgi:hypothetical protein
MKRLTTILTLAISLLVATPALAGGWYLMEPPSYDWVWGVRSWIEQELGIPIPAEAVREGLYWGTPLSNWVQLNEYETLAECREREELLHLDGAALSHEGAIAEMEHRIDDYPAAYTEFLTGREQMAKCVFGGDPRLAQ